MIERKSIVPVTRRHSFYEHTVKPGFQQDCPIFRRETDADRHDSESCSRATVARRLRPIARRASRLPARPCQRTHVLGNICAVARGGEIDARAAREQAVHARDSSLLGLDGPADDIPDNDPRVPARGESASASISTSTFTPTSSPIPPTVSRSAPARSSWSSCARRLRRAAANPRRSERFLAAHPNAKRFVEAPKPIPTSFRARGVLRRSRRSSSPTPAA